MDDTNIFGVQNPEDGEVGYCCVMGNAGELFGLGVYVGSAGLLGYEMVMSGAFEPGSLEVLAHMRCVMVEFEDRSALRPFDREVIKKSGVKFRGQKSWPLFTSYLPGYLPWRLTAKEARFLTTALRQAIEVAPRFAADNTLLDSPEPGEVFFVRIPQVEKTRLTWTNEWLEPAPIEVEDTSLDQLEEFTLKSLRKSLSTRDATWEVDVIPGPIIGDENDPNNRPFIGRVFMCVDQASLFVLNSSVNGPRVSLPTSRYLISILVLPTVGRSEMNVFGVFSPVPGLT